MNKINWKQKTKQQEILGRDNRSSSQHWHLLKATPETTERIMALISAIGVLVMYMLAEGIADNEQNDREVKSIHT